MQTTKNLTKPTDLNLTRPTEQSRSGVTTNNWTKTAGTGSLARQEMQWRTNVLTLGNARRSALAGIMGHILRSLITFASLFVF